MSHDRTPRRYTREFKLSALHRMSEAETIQQLAEELGIERTMLYAWRAAFRSGGEAGLREAGRPRRLVRAEAAVAAASGSAASGVPPSGVPPSGVPPERRIADLERKIGEQQVALDFFQAALRHVGERRGLSVSPGRKASTP